METSKKTLINKAKEQLALHMDNLLHKVSDGDQEADLTLINAVQEVFLPAKQNQITAQEDIKTILQLLEGKTLYQNYEGSKRNK